MPHFLFSDNTSNLLCNTSLTASHYYYQWFKDRKFENNSQHRKHYDPVSCYAETRTYI